MSTCAVTKQECTYHGSQKDCYGDEVLTFCNHPKNKSPYEGNTNFWDCPLISDDEKDMLDKHIQEGI